MSDIITYDLPSVIITYDLTGEQDLVKICMIKKGYKEKFPGDNTIIDLPDSTLFHSMKSSKQAIRDLKSCCEEYSVEIEKVVAIDFNPSNNKWAH
jgi:hypothetical protein